MGKGSRRERELVNLLWENGFAVMRAPASGSGRKHPQPDVLASDGNIEIGIEIKSSSSDVIYVKKKEVEKLREFCDKFGCKPLIGARFDHRGWLFVSPSECDRTEKSLKVTRNSTGLVLVEGEGLREQKTIT